MAGVWAYLSSRLSHGHGLVPDTPAGTIFVLLAVVAGTACVIHTEMVRRREQKAKHERSTD
jgi:hypothetical protein